MNPTTNELILSTIDKLTDAINNNIAVSKTCNDFDEFNAIENRVLKANIALYKTVLINQNTEKLDKVLDGI
ncbi:MAG: hypothetical protein WC389_21705 [Lutibacter sp.]|jgi:hypothetical protein